MRYEFLSFYIVLSIWLSIVSLVFLQMIKIIVSSYFLVMKSEFLSFSESEKKMLSSVLVAIYRKSLVSLRAQKFLLVLCIVISYCSFALILLKNLA